MAQTLRRHQSAGANERLLSWPAFPLAGAFDEAFANDDRGQQNILTDGKRFWLIDNEHAFANQYANIKNLRSNLRPYFANTLLDLAGQQQANNRLRLKDLLNRACGDIIKCIREAPFAQLVSDDDLRTGLQFFLDRRSPSLVEDCMSRLGLGTLQS